MMVNSVYGAISVGQPEIVFGGTRSASSAVNTRMEFNQMSETVSTNIFNIQSSGTNLERSLKALGTKQDTQGLRNSIHVIQMSTNQVVSQTSQDLVQLAASARSIGDRMFHLQVERLKSEFEKSLQRYSLLQKDVARKMKENLPYSKWNSEEAGTSQEQNAHLERVAEERHEKLTQLKTIEFEQEMLLEREQRIRQIESDMIDVNQIMKELSAMVHEQGENINSIENNIESTYTCVEEGRQQLEKASSYQRTHRKWLCFLTVIALIVAGVIALVLYFELK